MYSQEGPYLMKMQSEEPKSQTQWGAWEANLRVGGLQKPQRKKSLGVALFESLAETQVHPGIPENISSLWALLTKPAMTHSSTLDSATPWGISLSLCCHRSRQSDPCWRHMSPMGGGASESTTGAWSRPRLHLASLCSGQLHFPS